MPTHSVDPEIQYIFKSLWTLDHHTFTKLLNKAVQDHEH